MRKSQQKYYFSQKINFLQSFSSLKLKEARYKIWHLHNNDSFATDSFARGNFTWYPLLLVFIV